MLYGGMNRFFLCRADATKMDGSFYATDLQGCTRNWNNRKWNGMCKVQISQSRFIGHMHPCYCMEVVMLLWNHSISFLCCCVMLPLSLIKHLNPLIRQSCHFKAIKRSSHIIIIIIIFEAITPPICVSYFKVCFPLNPIQKYIHCHSSIHYAFY